MWRVEELSKERPLVLPNSPLLPPPSPHSPLSLFKQMLEKKSYPCDPLPFSSPSTDNKRQIKPGREGWEWVGGWGGRFRED